MALYLKKSQLFGPEQMSKGLSVEVKIGSGTNTGKVLDWGDNGITIECDDGLRGCIFYENIVKAYPQNGLSGEVTQIAPPDTAMEVATPEDIHALCDERGIPWDDDPDFMLWCHEVTGVARLDEMAPGQLAGLAEAIEAGERPASIHRWAEAVPETKKSWWKKIWKRA